MSKSTSLRSFISTDTASLQAGIPLRIEPSSQAIPTTGPSIEILRSPVAANIQRQQIKLPKVLELSPRRNVQLLQNWQGYVRDVSKEAVTAILQDKSDPTSDDEEIVFSWDEISEEDRPLAVPGAVFYLSIFYEEGLGQPRRRITSLRFRRLQQWTKSELNAARQAAPDVRRFFRSA